MTALRSTSVPVFLHRHTTIQTDIQSQSTVFNIQIMQTSQRYTHLSTLIFSSIYTTFFNAKIPIC